MQLVKNKIFYHIQAKTTSLALNQTKLIGNSLNPFFAYFDEITFPDTLNIEDMKSLIKEYQLFIRETLFEEERSKNYPSYPSRKTCIFLIPKNQFTPAIIHYWANTLGSENFELLKVSCTGKTFTGNAALLPNLFGHFPIYKEKAKEYWASNELPENLLTQEVLFEGELTVLEVHQLTLTQINEDVGIWDILQ